MVLHIIATPIGNLDDISHRAIERLCSCDIIACEDTRVSAKIFKKFNISKPLISYRDDNEVHVSDNILQYLRNGKNVCLLSDAGTPCISDPGFRIVRACRKNDLNVEVVPGACAAISALVGSGLPSDGFLFLGFLPAKVSARTKVFKKYLDFEYTIIFYESCHRIIKFLDDACSVFGDDRVVCVAKEITKIHEMFLIGRLNKVIADLSKSSLKGEFVVIVAPSRFEM